MIFNPPFSSALNNFDLTNFIAIRLVLFFFFLTNVNQLFKVSQFDEFLKLLQRKFTKFFQLVHHVFPSCLGGEVSRIEITFLLLSSGNLPGNFSPGKLACGKKITKLFKTSFHFFPPFLVSSSCEHLIPVAPRFLQPLPLENLIKCVHTYPPYLT